MGFEISENNDSIYWHGLAVMAPYSVRDVYVNIYINYRNNYVGMGFSFLLDLRECVEVYRIINNLNDENTEKYTLHDDQLTIMESFIMTEDEKYLEGKILDFFNYFQEDEIVEEIDKIFKYKKC